MKKDKHAVALGKKTSPAKAKAARENGKRGGRPSKEAQRGYEGREPAA